MSLSQPHPAPRRPGLVVGTIGRAAPAWLKSWLTDSSDHSRAQRSAGTAFLIRVASAGITYLSQVLLARWMGSFEFGVYIYVWTWVLLIGGLASIGLDTAAQRFIPEYSEAKFAAELRGFLSGSRWLATSVATVIGLAGMAGVWLFDPWLDRYEVIPLYLACFCIPLHALSAVQDGIARSYNWVNLALVPQYIFRPLLITLIMVGVHAAGFGNDASVAMLAAIAAVWATTLGQTFILNRRLRSVVAQGPKAYDPKAWLRVAAPIFAMAGFYLVLSYADIIVLQHYRPPQEVAYYYAAAKTLALVAFVNYSVSAVTGHKFAEYHVAGDKARLQLFFSETIRWTFWPSLAATVFILLLGKPLLWLFGPKFTEGYPLLFILCFGLLARSAIGPAERLLNMLNEQRACAYVYAVAATFNVALCLALIPPYGLYGAATASALALVAESVLMFVVIRKRLGFRVFILKRARE